MILVDTSLWIDHLRSEHPRLSALLNHGDVLVHPWVTGEIALGTLHHREEILGLLRGLPQAIVADHDEMLRFIDHHDLFGAGIEYVDAHLLASSRLTPDSALWTRDRRLSAVAESLGLAYQPPPARP